MEPPSKRRFGQEGEAVPPERTTRKLLLVAGPLACRNLTSKRRFAVLRGPGRCCCLSYKPTFVRLATATASGVIIHRERISSIVLASLRRRKPSLRGTTRQRRLHCQAPRRRRMS